MAVWKVHHETQYTVISNNVIKDMRLSLKTLGLFVKVLSLPPDWHFTETGLATICKDGLGAVRTALQELESCGYLIRTQEKQGDGKFTTSRYDFYEIPQNVKNTEQSSEENPPAEKPLSENPMTENMHNKVNNNKINTNKVNINTQSLTKVKQEIPTSMINTNNTSTSNSIEEIDIFSKNKTQPYNAKENSKAYNVLVNYIRNLQYDQKVINILVDWYCSVSKGRISIKQLKCKLAELDKLNLSADDLYNIINKSFMNNWMSFYPPTTNTYNNSRVFSNLHSNINTAESIQQVTDNMYLRNEDGSLIEF